MQRQFAEYFRVARLGGRSDERGKMWGGRRAFCTGFMAAKCGQDRSQREGIEKLNS